MYFQGNNIGVYDKTGKLVKRTDYYAYCNANPVNFINPFGLYNKPQD